MAEKQQLRHYSIKSCLAGLGASPEARSLLDRWLYVAQTIAVRATLVANQCLISCMQDGIEIPDITDQGFWYRCMACCGTLRGRKTSSSNPLIQRAYDELNSIHLFSSLELDKCWTVLNSMQRTLCSQAALMLKRTLHPEIKAFVRRRCLLWQQENGQRLSQISGNKKIVHQTVHYFLKKVFGLSATGRAQNPNHLPSDLLAFLHSKADDWKVTYHHAVRNKGELGDNWQEAFPGMKREKAQSMQDYLFSRDLIRWRSELHRLRGEDLAGMALLLGTTNERKVIRAFQRNAKSGSLLPLASPSMRDVQFDWTSLQAFAKQVYPGFQIHAPHGEERAKEPASKRARTSQTSEPATPEKQQRTRRKLSEEELSERCTDKRKLFLLVFPNLQKRLGKKFEFFQYHISTDGVACSILLGKPTNSKCKKRYVMGSTPKSEGRDLYASNSPLQVQSETDCLIGIDPGRRDMIFAVEHFSGQSLKYSTKQHAHESGRLKAAKITFRAYKGVYHQGEPLLTYIERNPPRDSIPSRWRAYLEHILPCLDAWMKVKRTRSIQRASFDSYMRRDRSLDELCTRICTLGNSGRKKRVFVAFGDASVTSTGFGYAPVPQKRLRHRLEFVHGARISLISEFYTSQMCHRCENKLQECYMRLQSRKRASDNSKPRYIHGILCCTVCKNSNGQKQYWHRDWNACHNIMRVFLSLALDQKRPAYLSKPEKVTDNN
jgi:hypothetical protein